MNLKKPASPSSFGHRSRQKTFLKFSLKYDNRFRQRALFIIRLHRIKNSIQKKDELTIFFYRWERKTIFHFYSKNRSFFLRFFAYTTAAYMPNKCLLLLSDASKDSAEQDRLQKMVPPKNSRRQFRGEQPLLDILMLKILIASN